MEVTVMGDRPETGSRCPSRGSLDEGPTTAAASAQSAADLTQNERATMGADAALAAKVAALGQVARACALSREHLELATTKTRRGHCEHGDGATANLFAELRGELADVAGYGGLFRWRGLWSWRLWAVVFLAGLQWRLLRCGPVRWWRVALVIGLLATGRPTE